MKKIIFLFILALTINLHVSNAQEQRLTQIAEDTAVQSHKNYLNTNLLTFVLERASLFYEHAYNNNNTYIIGVVRQIPKEYYGLKNFTSLLLGIKFYKEHSALDGFAINPYIRYQYSELYYHYYDAYNDIEWKYTMNRELHYISTGFGVSYSSQIIRNIAIGGLIGTEYNIELNTSYSGDQEAIEMYKDDDYLSNFGLRIEFKCGLMF
jgi:hypothetical protein